MPKGLSYLMMVCFIVVGPVAGWEAALAAENIKIGFIDAQEVLDNTQLGKKAKASMEEYRKSRERILELEQNDLKQLEETLTKQGGLLSDEARRDKQIEYQKKLEQLQRKVLEFNREVQDKQVQLIREFRKELEAIVKKIAKREGYTFILDRDAETGNVLYAEETHDLTKLAIREMDKANQ